MRGTILTKFPSLLDAFVAVRVNFSAGKIKTHVCRETRMARDFVKDESGKELHMLSHQLPCSQKVTRSTLSHSLRPCFL